MKPLQPVHIDGIIYVIMGFFGAIFASLSSDAAYKYVDPTWLFYGNMISEAIVAGATELITYRSKTYSDSVNKNTDTKV